MIVFFRSLACSLMLFSGYACNQKKEENIEPQIASSPVSPSVKSQVEDTSNPGNLPVRSYAIRQGLHNFTLHWISWEKPGQVKINEGNDGWYTIKGGQRDENGNFVSIEGELQVVLPTELHFRGVIIEKVETLNQGDTCIRKGEQIFLSTKNRKYWRLQNMVNCEGSGVVDYIDIYY